MSRYSESYINFTVNFQVNDARQLPIIIPSEKQLVIFQALFKQASDAKKKFFASAITENKANAYMQDIQKELNIQVNKLYGI